MSLMAEHYEEPADQIRDELVNTAVKFLQNPRVQQTSLAEQQRFLKRKGLNDDEVRLACERSGAYDYHQQLPPPLPVSTEPPVPLLQQNRLIRINWLDRLREIVHNFAAFSFVAYVLYKFYKKFLAPFLFGRKKKDIEKSLEEFDSSIRSSIEDLKGNLSSVKVEVDKLAGDGETKTQRQLSELKYEIATVKGLLLSRNQFPTPVSKASSLTTSIPEWQKSSISQDSDAESEVSHKTEDLLEVGSGSGSSEPEHNTKNSDSSLEILSFSSSDYHGHRSKDDPDKEQVF